MDAINAIDSVTFEMDRDNASNYHERFRAYLRFIQDNDLVVDGAMTDPKGDRSRRPSQQVDPDMYLRVARQSSDGIFIRGAKAHQTGAGQFIGIPNADHCNDRRRQGLCGLFCDSE